MVMQQHTKKSRIQSALAVGLVHLLAAMMLFAGLNVDVVRSTSATLTMIDVRELPPPPPETQAAPDSEDEGGAAPPDLQAQASPVVAPEPVIELPRQSPVVAAPVPNIGAESAQGAAQVAGPGTGAGGDGTGTGSGNGGNGPGGGAPASRARRIAGDIRSGDYPPAARRARIEGTVGATVYVGSDGRVSRCVVSTSSGNAELDAITCRLIEERFRYDPARTLDGTPVADVAGRTQRWWLRRD